MKTFRDISADALRSTITDIDGVSQEGLSQIESLSNLALNAINSKNYAERDIARVFLTIRGIAQETHGCISSIAIGVGCEWVDEIKG